nr:uncharacterized protein LOC121821101 [Peromyscus maniculatus bairdii]
MVAAQQWRPRPRVGECGARPGVLAAAAAARCPPRPGSVSEGETRRCRCGSPSRWARDRSRVLPRAPIAVLGGSANPAAAAPSRSCTTLPAVTSAETDRGQGGKVTGKDERSRARAPYTRARGPRAEKLAEGARPTFTIYRASATRSPAHRRHGGPIAGFEKAEPETRRGGRGAGTKEPTGLEGLARPRGRGEGLGAGELRSGCYARPLPPLAVPGHPPALVRWPAPASISGSPGDLGPFLASGTPPTHTHTYWARFAAGPPPLGPGWVGEGHSGTLVTLPSSAPPLRSCTCRPLAISATAVAVPARPSPSRPAQRAAWVPDSWAVLLVGGLNHLKPDNCQTHPGL